MKDWKDLKRRIKDHFNFREATTRDLMTYAGSKRFPDGSMPLIKNCDDFDIIFDANGIAIISETDELDLIES